jgi:hypothetical protein
LNIDLENKSADHDGGKTQVLSSIKKKIGREWEKDVSENERERKRRKR